VQETYTSRRAIRREGKEHFAEITVRAQPGPSPSEVVLSPAVLAQLREAFGGDFEHARHCVYAAVAAQIGTANVAGEMPHVGSTFFHAEVVEVKVSGNAGREIGGVLLTMAGMGAIGAYLEDWEDAQAGPADSA
jgi:hypothetical protein